MINPQTRSITMRNSQHSIDISTFEVREKHIELNREALLHIAGRDGIEVLIIRVHGYSHTGRPTSRTLRIPVGMLHEPTEPDDNTHRNF
jgi:hypothetical protein